jgi:hypothetical protein
MAVVRVYLVFCDTRSPVDLLQGPCNSCQQELLLNENCTAYYYIPPAAVQLHAPRNAYTPCIQTLNYGRVLSWCLVKPSTSACWLAAIGSKGWLALAGC